MSEFDKITDKLPELYDDLLKPAVQEAGNILSFPLELINSLLCRPRQWVANAEYKIKETNALIANKLKYIEEEKLVTPPDFVAVPALQALSYSIDNENLREMYANLLAKAMTTDTCEKVHPAYIEIIKQFSPLDAKLFQYIISELSDDNDLTLFNIHFNSEGKKIREYKYIVNYQEASLSDIAQSVDNFIRCGLISLRQLNIMLFLEGNESEWVRSWANVQNELSDEVEMELDLCTAAYITELGRNFFSICCS